MGRPGWVAAGSSVKAGARCSAAHKRTTPPLRDFTGGAPAGRASVMCRPLPAPTWRAARGPTRCKSCAPAVPKGATSSSSTDRSGRRTQPAGRAWAKREGSNRYGGRIRAGEGGVKFLTSCSTIPAMEADLDETHWRDVAEGQLTGPDSTRYVRRTTRSSVRDAEQLIRAGAPLVLYYWAGGRLEWRDGEDAMAQWRVSRSQITRHERAPKKNIRWTIGRWEADDGRPLVVLTGDC